MIEETYMIRREKNTKERVVTVEMTKSKKIEGTRGNHSQVIEKIKIEKATIIEINLMIKKRKTRNLLKIS